MVDHIAGLRLDYRQAALDEHAVASDPLTQFDVWFHEALAANLLEPNAMTLATAGADGMPSARVVLLKGYDDRGFVFYTSHESRKGLDLDANPRAALVFYWPELERQVRVNGDVARLTTAENEAYFRSRPPGSQLAAWASRQSQVIASRAELEARWQALAREFADRPVPPPPHWGGYRVTPRQVEFWQGRPDRLHDRIRYRRQAEGGWVVERLAP
jgi:pyridoxamine 5'-phosphate oxidase